MDLWLQDHLVCPREGLPLIAENEGLGCNLGHSYPIVDGIPILLLDEADPTYPEYTCSLDSRARALEMVQGERCAKESLETGKVDSYVAAVLGASNGALYKKLINNLLSYPIPAMRLPQGNGQRLLDIGCMWGRWSIAAARLGYSVIGVDASFGGILAARRVARHFDLPISFLVADARRLPFRDKSFAVAFSYSVIQHFSRSDYRATLDEIHRVLEPGGESHIQMANKLGGHNLLHLARRGFSEGEAFNVRYYSPAELIREFSTRIGPTTLSVDGYFGLGIQAGDAHMLPLFERTVVHVSELLRRVSQKTSVLRSFADSLYLDSINS